MQVTRIEVPDPALILLVGATGVGKSTFARAHFGATEVVSSDRCRALVADEETDQSATPAAFRLLDLITTLRLERGRLTVIDATNVQPVWRRQLVALARPHQVPCVAILFDLPLEVSLARDRTRAERHSGPAIVRRHHGDLRRSPPTLEEGFERVWVLRTAEEVSAVAVTRRRSPLPGYEPAP